MTRLRRLLSWVRRVNCRMCDRWVRQDACRADCCATCQTEIADYHAECGDFVTTGGL